MCEREEIGVYIRHDFDVQDRKNWGVNGAERIKIYETGNMKNYETGRGS